jgi:hypothetical protein
VRPDRPTSVNVAATTTAIETTAKTRMRFGRLAAPIGTALSPAFPYLSRRRRRAMMAANTPNRPKPSQPSKLSCAVVDRPRSVLIDANSSGEVPAVVGLSPLGVVGPEELVMVAGAPPGPEGVEVLVELATTGMVDVEGSDGGDPSCRVSIPVAVAVSMTFPAARSAASTTCETSPVQVVEDPGGKPGVARTGQFTFPPEGSDTVTEVRSTFPLFVTWNE